MILKEYIECIFEIAGQKFTIKFWLMPSQCPFAALLGREWMHNTSVIEDYGEQVMLIRDGIRGVRQVYGTEDKFGISALNGKTSFDRVRIEDVTENSSSEFTPSESDSDDEAEERSNALYYDSGSGNEDSS